MSNAVSVITRGVYALAGVLALLLGIVPLLTGTGLLPQRVTELVFEFGVNDPVGIHVVQEMCTLYVLLGVMFLWFARHYEQSLRFHWLVTGWALLLFWVHWFTAYGEFRNEPAVIVDLIPFSVLLVLGLLRRRLGQV
jgi:Na+(H+)/acetate symporter ActP